MTTCTCIRDLTDVTRIAVPDPECPTHAEVTV